MSLLPFSSPPQKLLVGGFTLYVDSTNGNDSSALINRVDKPFKTISAAITQIITNNDNSSNAYNIEIAPGTYSETLSFNNTALVNISFSAPFGGVTLNKPNATVITSTSNNTQLATLSFTNLTINGNLNFTGDTNNTNFGSSQIIFIGCSFNLSSGGITLNNVNNVSFYGGQIQGSSVSTWTNVAFAYVQGAEGFKNNTTLHLVQNNGTNQPSQSSGNYLLLSETKVGSTVTIDSGSEMDAIQTYFSSTSNITNNGTIHSFQSTWSGSTTFNSGSTTRLRGDTINTNPTLNGGAVTTNQSTIYLGTAAIGSSAKPFSNSVLVLKDGHIKSTQTTAPTIAVEPSAGTGASVSIANATDTSGQITIITGTVGLSTGSYARVTFNKTYNVAPLVLLTPANSTISTSVYATSTTTTFDINFALAGGISSTYVMNYVCLETQ